MANRHLTGAGFAALLAFHPSAAFAAEPSNLEAVVVTAGRGPDGVAAGRVGSAVTLIGIEDLEDRQARLVSDLLRDVPGVAVSRLGGPGGQTQLRLRGAEANHVLTLIDGVEAADPFQGEFDYAGLLADDVARIEILRGPQSALYGSDAVAGVVNYITPSAREAPGGRLRVEFGSQGTLGGAGRYAAAKGPLDLVVSGGVQRTDGYVGQTLPGGTRKLGSTLQGASARASWQASEALTLRGVLRYADTHAEVDDSVYGLGQVDSPGSYYDAKSLTWLAGADLRLLEGAWTHSLSVSGLDARREGYSANVRSSGDEGVRAKVSYVTAYGFEAGGLSHTLTGAVDWEKETYQNTSPPEAGADGTRRSVKNLGLVAQYDVGLGERGGIGAAVRRDENEFFADATTWKLQGVYRASEALRLRAAAGTGMKTPGQTELFGYNATGPFPFKGNPDLKPETSRGWEAGFDLSVAEGRAGLSATWFEAKLKDEIFTYFGGALPAGCPAPPPGVSTTCNQTSRSSQRGAELAGSVAFSPSLSLTGAYTWLDAEEDGTQEIRRARHIGSADLTWKPLAGRATVNLTVRYNGRQLDTNFSGIDAPFPASLPKVREGAGEEAGKVVLPAFTLVNLDVAYRIGDHFEVFARAENLTDEDYYEVFGFPSQPRAVYAGARVAF